ncbi:hypothetical protein TRIUR3_07444 [Triticum urartu]|uniref:Yippee domain-containing protein n=1 Tax=Triticum urartu TaxID=4572 RepID=M8AP88_TRIUA|nr:hypothetical protein TRIUR3_07444 [Triticum urartu]
MGRLFLMHLEGNAYSCKFCRTHLGLAADIISKNFHSKHGKAYLFNRVPGAARLPEFVGETMRICQAVARLVWVIRRCCKTDSDAGRLACSVLQPPRTMRDLERVADANAYAATHRPQPLLGRGESKSGRTLHRMGSLSFSLDKKCVNVTSGINEDRMMMTGLHTVSDIFCVGCGSIVGWKYEAAHDKSQRYKEGKFILERFKVSGPDGSHYWGGTHDAHHGGGSDTDDL